MLAVLLVLRRDWLIINICFGCLSFKLSFRLTLDSTTFETEVWYGNIMISICCALVKLALHAM